MDEIIDIMNQMTFANCKIVAGGRNILSQDVFSAPLSDVIKEQYMKT